MKNSTYVVTFEGVSPADANRFAEELRDALLDATPDIVVQRTKENHQTQNFGDTLVVVLGTPAATAAVTAVVTTVSNWLQLRKNASINWKSADGELSIQNISSKNAIELAERLLKKK